MRFRAILRFGWFEIETIFSRNLFQFIGKCDYIE
jgi:hypothetical protein